MVSSYQIWSEAKLLQYFKSKIFWKLESMQLMLKLDKVLTIFLSPILFYVKLPALSQTLRQDEVGFFLFLIMN